MYRSTAVTLLLGGALAGCTVGPNYAQPASTTVVGGMLAATVIAIFIIPVTFYVSERFGRKREQVTARAVALVPIQGGSGDAPGHP